MVKLTPELIEQSIQFTNTVRDYELDLRGYKIPVIENLGATLDQFDTLELSDNEIRKLDGFPYLPRLSTILLNNNRIARIGEHLEECLPKLESLILTNNNLTELADLDNLASIKTLRHLSLLRNPVITKTNYRLYVAHKIPQLRTLDFQKLKLKDREAATKLFKVKKTVPPSPKDQKESIAKMKKTGLFSVGEMKKKLPPTPAPIEHKDDGPSKQDIEAIKKAIASAKTLEEIEKLNKLLQSGLVPGKEFSKDSAIKKEEDS